MPLQIRVTLYKCIVKITYFYSLLLGILPGVYNAMEQKYYISTGYLLYSAFIQISFLAITPLTSPVLQQNDNYMSNKPILLYAYMVGKFSRVLTVVVISAQTWLRRQNVILLNDSYKRFLLKYQSFREYFQLHFEQDLNEEQQRLQLLMIYKFVSLHIHAFAITLLYIEMEDEPKGGYLLMVSLNLLQGIYLLAANLQFMLILSELRLQFFYVNKSLEYMSCATELPLKPMLNYYLVVYDLHTECLQLACNLLKACSSVTCFMLVKIFCSNIIILYHAVLIMLSTLPSHSVSNTVGSLCIINFYWDSLLTMTAVDNVLVAGNRASAILQGTWITLKGEDNKEDYVKILQVLNEFSDYLACNKLEFCIYGLIKMDNATSFKHFVAAFLHLIILVQFDLKKRLEAKIEDGLRALSF